MEHILGVKHRSCSQMHHCFLSLMFLLIACLPLLGGGPQTRQASGAAPTLWSPWDSQLVTSVCPARHCAIANGLPNILPGCEGGGERDSWAENEHLHAAHTTVLCKALLPWHPCRKQNTCAHLDAPVPQFFFSSSPCADQFSDRD